MTVEGLALIKNFMEKLEIPYEFKEFHDPPNTYLVGDYTEVTSNNYEECGECESTFLLDGFTRDSWISLERIKEKIRNALPIRAITESGSAVALFYDNANPVNTGDAEIKRIHITLNVKEWRVK